MSLDDKRKRTSDILASVIANTDADGDITVRELLSLMGERAFGLAILVFSLPNSLPIPSPPGFSAITGIPIILLALQMTLGLDTPWLPKKIGNYRFSRRRFSVFLDKALPYVRKVERMLHPRLLFMQSWWGEKITGLAFIFLAGVLSMPIPLGNFLPGLSMSLIALGLLERDGALMLLGIVGGLIASVAIFTALGAAALAALYGLMNFF